MTSGKMCFTRAFGFWLTMPLLLRKNPLPLLLTNPIFMTISGITGKVEAGDYKQWHLPTREV